jgi:serine/threonine protein kinase
MSNYLDVINELHPNIYGKYKIFALPDMNNIQSASEFFNTDKCWCSGHRVAVKILENVADNIEEIEEEYLVLRDLSMHPNIPAFHGLFLRPGQTQEEDQLWFVMEVSLSPFA